MERCVSTLYTGISKGQQEVIKEKLEQLDWLTTKCKEHTDSMSYLRHHVELTYGVLDGIIEYLDKLETKIIRGC